MLFIDLVNIISREFFCERHNVYHNIFQLFLISGIGAIARPLGAFIFGHVGDKYGRKIALPISILLVSIPSSMISILPSNNELGIASSVILLIVYVIQGIGLGAEQGGSSVYMIEHLSDKKKKLGMLFGITGFGRSIGIFLAAIVVMICKKVTDFDNFGWRIPFVFSAVLGFISAYSIFKLGETPLYKSSSKQVNLPIIELFKHYKRSFTLAILIAVPVNVVVGFSIFLRTLVKAIISVELYTTTYINEIVSIVTSILMPIFSILFGILSDKIGRERTSIIFILITIIISCPLLSIAYHCKSYLIMMLSIMTLSLIERGINPIGIIALELFPTNVRFSGLTLSRNISYALHGSFTPMICMWFTIMFPQVNFAAGIYVAFCLFISLIAILQIKPTDKKGLISEKFLV